MLLVLVALGTTDILLALDPIPAIFGLTSEPYVVPTADLLALMGCGSSSSSWATC